MYREISWSELTDCHIDREIADVMGVAEQAREGVDAAAKLIGVLIQHLVEEEVMTAETAFSMLQNNHYNYGNTPEFKLIHEGGKTP